MWEINGIEGSGKLPLIAGTFSGPLVIMGSGRCLWDDLRQVNGNPEYMSVNMAGCFAYKRLSHWASKHPETLPHCLWFYMRWNCPTETDNSDWNFFAHVFKPKVYLHGPKESENNWDFITPSDGSSSMFGVLVALALGYNPIYLAGVPLDGSGSFYDPPWFRCVDYSQYRKYWVDLYDLFKGRVKSYSGFTRELLGSPN